MSAALAIDRRRAALDTPARGLLATGLRHHFGRRLVVAGIDLAVPGAAVHCLVGPSGCGKTTTLRLIAGLEAVQEGTVRVDGRVVAGPSVELPPERRRVGLMFQDFALFPHLRVADNVGFGLAGLDRAARRGRVTALLERVGMGGHAFAWPHTLSGGEQQRVALARALAAEPALLLLDEAFSALDPTLRPAVRTSTLDLLRETGTPTLLVTHDGEEAIASGDRVHVMEAGRIIQEGTPKELWVAPASPFVAGFFGPVFRHDGRVARGFVATPVGAVPAAGPGEGTAATVVVRLAAMAIRPPDTALGPTFRVLERRDLGPAMLYTLGLPDGATLRLRGGIADGYEAGQAVRIDLDPGQCFVYPKLA